MVQHLWCARSVRTWYKVVSTHLWELLWSVKYDAVDNRLGTVLVQVTFFGCSLIIPVRSPHGSVTVGSWPTGGNKHVMKS